MNIAIYAAIGLGDGLLSLMVANQLHRLGHKVFLYSSILMSMQNWVPDIVIKRFPDPSSLEAELADYDYVIAADHTPVSRQMQPSDGLTILYQKKFDKSKTMVSNLLAYLHSNWNPNATAETGFQLPVALDHRRYQERVVIHPTSAVPDKDWPAKKFLRLAQRLRHHGYNPVIMVSPAEAAEWQWVNEYNLPLIIPPSIDAMARYIYESGYLIGNDSGAGHLASLLSIPTLSLFARYSYSRLWRPGWGAGLVATPLLPLPGSRLKQKYWKELLTVGHVVRTFRKLSASSQLTAVQK